MSIANQLIKRAIILSKEGKKLDARQVLSEVLRREPKNATAWLWYVDTFPDGEERIIPLQLLLQALPNHPMASRALASLEKTKRETVQVPPPQRQPARLINWIAPLVLIIGICAITLGGAGLINIIKFNSQISGLKTENTSLNNRIIDLSNEVNSLTLQHQDLVSRHQQLEVDYAALQAIAIVPPYISVANRNMVIGFTKTDQSSNRWEVNFDTLEAELQRGNAARNSIYEDNSMWVHLENTNTGQVYDVVDMTRFVDPSAFGDVIPDLYTESGSEDAFIREVWNIVTQLATYSADLNETPRYPLETFLAGGGDCEDTAILFASMILAAPVNWDVELLYMDIDHPLAPQDVNHVTVYIDTGSQQYVVETTESEVMEPYTQGVDGWYFPLR